jgi:hypothetical protein
MNPTVTAMATTTIPPVIEATAEAPVAAARFPRDIEHDTIGDHAEPPGSG